MANELPIPPELQSLIEKRDGDDRRKAARRKTTGAKGTGAVPAERRVTKDRRKRTRRSG